MSWVGLKQIAYQVQIMNEPFIHKKVKSLKDGQLLITRFVNSGLI